MGVFEQFPYTNFHDLNLDWILKKVKDLEQTVSGFTAQNLIKYADPLAWNITQQYEKNTVVVDPASGIAYMSNQAVPEGITLTNTEYWSVIFDYNQYPTYNETTEAVTFRGRSTANNINEEVE